MKDRIATLIDSLFILVSSFNAVLDRLDTLTERNEELYERHQELIHQNQEAFKLDCEDFLRRLIEADVNKYTNKKQRGNIRRANFGSDIVRKTQRS